MNENTILMLRILSGILASIFLGALIYSKIKGEKNLLILIKMTLSLMLLGLNIPLAINGDIINLILVGTWSLVFVWNMILLVKELK